MNYITKQTITHRCTHTGGKKTHLWGVVGIKASPWAVWTGDRAERTVHRALRHKLPPHRQWLKHWVRSLAKWSLGGRHRACGVAGYGTGQAGTPRKAGESPVACWPSPLCLTIDRHLVACCVLMFARLWGGRQVSHGVGKLYVLVILNGQSGQLEQ